MIPYTHLRRDNDPQGERRNKQTWEELFAMFRNPLPNTIDKKALPMWSPALFEGDYRHSDFLESVFALGFDVDVDPIPAPEAIAAFLPGFLGIYHTSSRATASSPRGRLILPLSRSVTGPEYRACWRAVSDAMPFAVGTSAKDPSRAWYAPRVGPDGFYRCIVSVGRPWDVDILLSAAGGPEAELPKAELVAPVGVISPSELSPTYNAQIDTIAAACAVECPGIGRRNELSLSLSGALCSDGNWHVLPAEDIPAIVHEICRCAGFGSLRKKFTNALQTVTKKRGAGAVSGWPTLRRDFPKVAEAIDAAFPTPDPFGLLK